jgi:serine/threonine protein kinase
MDAIDEDYEELSQRPDALPIADEIKAKIISLHQAGFVHGDIRDTNIMVRKDGKAGFMLVDFDWAGEIGVVRYPMNVNRGPDLWRPEGALDGELITADDDMQMLENMLTPRPSAALSIAT